MPFKDKEHNKEYMRDYRKRNLQAFVDYKHTYEEKVKKLGKCRCGREKDESQRYCNSCRSSWRKGDATKKATRKAKGLCVRCGKTKPSQKGVCENCKEVSRRHLQKLRTRVLEHYGHKCACCGETERMFLALDHKNNDGNHHRKTVQTGHICGWILKNNFPDTIQILCHNCNFAKHINGGTCPHKTKRRD